MPVAQESIPPAENVGPAQRKKKKTSMSQVTYGRNGIKKKKKAIISKHE